MHAFLFKCLSVETTYHIELKKTGEKTSTGTLKKVIKKTIHRKLTTFISD